MDGFSISLQHGEEDRMKYRNSMHSSLDEKKHGNTKERTEPLQHVENTIAVLLK